MDDAPEQKKTTKKQIIRFVFNVNALVWFMTLPTLSVYLLIGQGVLFDILYAVSAWTPTIALLLSFRKLCPGNTVTGFYKNAFQERLNFKILLTVSVIHLLIFVGSVSIVAFTRKVAFGSLLSLSAQSIFMCFRTSITQGATGEESGWRGFLQPALEKNNGMLKASALTGVIWWFWHMPVMLFISGHSGWAWVQYVFTFLIACISMAMVIAVCYNRCKNLFVPIWFHFLFNFTAPMFIDFNNGEGELFFLTIVTALYALAAAGYMVWHKKRKGDIAQ